MTRNAVRAALLSAVVAWPASAQQPSYGIAAPLSGPVAPLGEQLRDGAWLGLSSLSSATAYLADDGCEAEGGERAANQFVEKNVAIVIGFLCTEAAEAALPILTEANIPVLSPGVRTDSLTRNQDKTGYLFFRNAPRTGHEAAAAARIVASRWREELFAIVDDGTIYGRELAEAVRFAAEQSGIEPVFVDTYRPQLDNQIALVGRLRRAGATHVFVGGDRDDVAIIARDARELDYSLTVAGGEALRAPGNEPLPAGVLMVGLPDWDRRLDQADLERFRAAELVPEGYVVPAFAAAQIALAATRDDDPEAILRALRDMRFDTIAGPVKFDANGDLGGNPYELFRWDGTRFVPVES
ncbi:MAG: branched-chain amino acid ABC transporter substrate-binding protein [Rhizobiaceae bacterium]|nr:branched-chain amino acid ABC transporter substrate-binding protein [Rhizobiaceae bacterium]MCV0408864.1 branched-chain amino acid ABC transporter substrate-binding protein [Rhizobiaceae bacterium]